MIRPKFEAVVGRTLAGCTTARVRFLLASALLSGACVPMNNYYDASKPHHTPEGFRNTAATSSKSTSDFLRWQRERRHLDIPAIRTFRNVRFRFSSRDQNAGNRPALR